MTEQTFELDIDRERVRFDGEWLGADDLAERIRQKVEAGDFKVARLSLALEQLESTLAGVRTVSLKLTPETIEAFERMAGHEGVPLSYVLRRALVHYLGSDEGSARLMEARREPDEPRSTLLDAPRVRPEPAEAEADAEADD